MTSSPVSVHWLNDAPRRPRRIALGTFDGVHRGHRQVIRGADTVLTFWPHPRAIIGRAPALLSDPDAKFELLGSLGASEVVLIPFDREVAAMQPGAFIDRVLVESLSATHVAVGANFHFGARGLGDVADLVADRRFETIVEPLMAVDGRTVSSSRIRSLVEAGDIVFANALLGDAFTVRVWVEPEEGRHSARASWPRGIVRPAPGTYALAPMPVASTGGFAAGRLVVEEFETRLHGLSPLQCGPLLIALGERIAGPRVGVASAAALSAG